MEREELEEIVWFFLVIPWISGQWKVFNKAGQKGWGSLIPVYDCFLMLRIAHISTKWLFVWLFPYWISFVLGSLGLFDSFDKGTSMVYGMVIIVMITYLISLAIHLWIRIRISKKFGYGWVFGVGLAVFPFICWPILGFGKSRSVEQP